MLAEAETGHVGKSRRKLKKAYAEAEAGQMRKPKPAGMCGR